MTFESPEIDHEPEEIGEVPPEEPLFEVGNLSKEERAGLRALLEEIRNKP